MCIYSFQFFTYYYLIRYKKDIFQYLFYLTHLHRPVHTMSFISVTKTSLREKCPYSEFFWSLFSCIWTEFEDLLRKSPYSVQMQENIDERNSKHGRFFTQCIPPYNRKNSLLQDPNELLNC